MTSKRKQDVSPKISHLDSGTMFGGIMGNRLTAKLIVNSTQIPNLLLDEILPNISGNEFKLLMVIARQTFGWHKEQDRISYSQLIRRTGTSNGTIGSALKTLREMELIQVVDEKGKQLLTKEDCYGKDIFYRLCVTSPNIGDPLSKYWNPNSGDTKETNTKDVLYKYKTYGVSKKKPSCPLLSGSLKSKWPKGHVECAEYVTTLKFVNKGKQFMFLHKMLRSGLDFPDIDKIINRIQKKPFYQENGWDFATVASEADRRSNASA